MKKPRIEETILSPILERYFSVDSLDSYELHIETRERISTIRNMQILIYSNDHNPPHFHVKSRDNSINAKFKIENGEFLSGKIESKDLKRVNAFYNDMKTKIVMEMIWNKRNN